MTERFKHWTIPGQRPAPSSVAPAQGESLDSLSGHFKIFQLKDGHRFSTDDLLVAWYGLQAAPQPAKILDLGSGIGTIAQIAAWKIPGAQITAIEAQEVSRTLMLKSLVHNGLEVRVRSVLSDFREEGLLGTEAFDLIFGSPPYFPLGTGVHPPHPQKLACRFEVRGDVVDYLKTMCAHLAPGGVSVLVFPYEQDARVLEAASRTEMSLFRKRPIVLHEGEPPLLALYGFTKEGDLPKPTPVHLEPPLVIRTQDGSVSPEYRCIKLSIGFPP